MRLFISFTFLLSQLVAQPAQGRLTFLAQKPEIKVEDRSITAKLGIMVPVTATVSAAGGALSFQCTGGRQVAIGPGQANSLANFCSQSYLVDEQKQLQRWQNDVLKGRKTDKYRMMINNGHFAQVIKELKKTSRAERLHALGLAYARAGKTTLARRSLFKAAKLSKPAGRIKVETTLAILYLNEGRYRRARQRLRFVIKKLETRLHTPAIYYLSSRVHQLMGDWPAARADQKKLQTLKKPALSRLLGRSFAGLN